MKIATIHALISCIGVSTWQLPSFEVQRKPDTKSVGLMLPFGRYILVLPVKLATTPTEAVPLQMI